MASTRKGYIAVKRETTVATAVTPTHFLRFKDGDMNYKPEIIANNPIQGNRWNALNAVEGKATADGSYNVDLDANEAPHFISIALGSMVSTDISSLTDGSVYRHDIDVADTLPAISLEQGKGNLGDTSNNRQNYQIDRGFGVLVDSIVFSGSDGILNMAVNLKAHGVFQKADLTANAAAGATVDIALKSVEGLVAGDGINIFDHTPQNEVNTVASIDTVAKEIQVANLANSYTVANRAKVELLPQTPSYGCDPQVFSFVHARFQFGADLTAAALAEDENIENWELSYENNLEERFGSLRNTPSVVAPKAAKATMKFSKYFENVEDRDRYLDRAKRACILTITNDIVVSATDTSLAKYTIKFLINDVRFTAYEMPTGTDELYAISAETEFFLDCSEGKALQIQITNAKPGTEYTA